MFATECDRGCAEGILGKHSRSRRSAGNCINTMSLLPSDLIPAAMVDMATPRTGDAGASAKLTGIYESFP